MYSARCLTNPSVSFLALCLSLFLTSPYSSLAQESFIKVDLSIKDSSTGVTLPARLEVRGSDGELMAQLRLSSPIKRVFSIPIPRLDNITPMDCHHYESHLVLPPSRSIKDRSIWLAN